MVGKLIKYTIVSIVGLCLISAIAIIALVTIVNPNRFKPAIEKSVNEATGRTLVIVGDINWTIYPNLGIKLNNVTLSNPDGFTSRNFMSFNSADVSVALFPLLKRHIAFKTLAIDGLHVSLVEKNGINNWSFTKSQKPSTSSEQETKEQSKPLKLELGGFSLTHANINYDNFDNNKHYKLNNIKLLLDTGFSGGILFNQEKSIVNLDKVQINYNDQILANLDFEITNLSNPKFGGEFEVSKLMLNAMLTNFNLAQGKTKLNLLDNIAFNGKITGDINQAKITDLKFNLSNKIKGNTDINVTNLKHPTLEGNIKVDSFNLNQLLDSLVIANSSRVKKPLLNNLTVSTNFKITPNDANITNLIFNFGSDLSGKVNLNIQNFAALNYNGNINLNQFSLNNLMHKLGESAPNIANKQWLDNVSFNSGLQGSKDSIKFRGLNLKISDTIVNGELSVNSFKPIVLNENLFINSLDVADISNINGYRVPMHQIQLNGNSTFNLANPKRSLSGRQMVKIGNITLKGISFDKLVLELDKNINKAGQGNDNVMKILMNGADILQAVNKMKQEVSEAIKPAKRDLNKTTNLGNFILNTNINQGMINPSDFKLNGPNAEVSGSGSVDLVTKALNYKATAKLNVNGINPIFKKLEFPVALTGTTLNPNATVNWASIEQQLIHYAVNENKGQIQNAVKQGINQAVGDQVKKSIGDKNADKAVDDVSKAVTNAIGGLFGGSSK